MNGAQVEGFKECLAHAIGRESVKEEADLSSLPCLHGAETSEEETSRETSSPCGAEEASCQERKGDC